MSRISSMPCNVPSSPGRPCSRLSATSGLSARNVAAISRFTSTRLTRYPVRSSASAQALPERNDTSRSADHPPIKTATCFIASAFYSKALDLPFEFYTRVCLYFLTDGLAKRFDIGRGRAAEIDQKVAVKFGHLRPTNGKAAAAGVVYQFPCAMAWRILERRPTGTIARLACLALFLDRGHFGGDLLGFAATSHQNGGGENHVVGHAAMSIGKTHFAIAEGAHVALAVDCVRFNQNVLRFTAIGATIHAQCAANRARNATEKGEPRYASRLRGAPHHHVEHGRAGGDATILDLHVIEAAAEADHHAFNSPVTHNQI